MQKSESILKRILTRNQKVDEEKRWKESLTHRLSVTVLIYIISVCCFYFASVHEIFIVALIPSLGYFISTIKLKLIRHIWEKYQ